LRRQQHLGDLATPPAFELARRLRKAPRAIAQEIAAALGPIDGCSLRACSISAKGVSPRTDPLEQATVVTRRVQSNIQPATLVTHRNRGLDIEGR
jgi:arginyl-tRNA synthetase